MGNYDWLFYEFEKEETHWDKLPRYQAYFRGSRHIDGAQIYLPYRAFIKEGVISLSLIHIYIAVNVFVHCFTSLYFS